MSYFVCLAQILSKPGKEKKLIKALSALIKSSNGEPGCVSYELFQNVNQPQTLTMIEFYLSQEDFDYHRTQDYVQHFHATSDDLIESAELILCLTIE
jgi:quinol monooxygenase YgiN